MLQIAYRDFAYHLMGTSVPDLLAAPLPKIHGSSCIMYHVHHTDISALWQLHVIKLHLRHKQTDRDKRTDTRNRILCILAFSNGRPIIYIDDDDDDLAAIF